MSKKGVVFGLSSALIGMILGAAVTVALAKQGHMEEAYHHLQGGEARITGS
jgi:hypothetical protein